MTTKTFFDKGIYKNTLRRFTIGSVLYFIMLFLVTNMLLLLAYEPHSFWGYGRNASLILEEEFIYFPMAIAMVVPTVVALLCYRFVHSKKTSVFTHSLPVTKLTNYLSTLLGAFTLMAAPVVANGAILSVLSLTMYKGDFSFGDTLVWILFNLLVLFVMFSVATFAAMFTGNSFALVAFNGIILAVVPLVASITETILVEFLFGYSYERSLLHFAEEVNPVMFLGEVANAISNVHGTVSIVKIVLFSLAAVLLYVLSYFFYKYRHMERNEDVAGFKAFNPILKYAVTFIGTLTVFSIFSQFISEKPVFFTFMIVLFSLIFYFGSEMILKKTVKVWHSYKGYLVFGGVFTLFILFISLTSVFGYETYVPETDRIQEAAIYNYYYQSEKPFTEIKELNEYITEVHSEFVDKKNTSILNHEPYHDTRIHIAYKLKNGKMVTRRYGVDYETNRKIMNAVYKYKEYKRACEEVFNDNIKEINSISIDKYQIEGTREELKELLECIKQDVDALSYDEIHTGRVYSCYMHYTTKDESQVVTSYKNSYTSYVDNTDWMDFYITKHFKNTINWLEENGYGHVMS